MIQTKHMNCRLKSIETKKTRYENIVQCKTTGEVFEQRS